MREKTSLFTLLVVGLSLGVSGCANNTGGGLFDTYHGAVLSDQITSRVAHKLGPQNTAIAAGVLSLGVAGLEAMQNQKQQKTSTTSTTTPTSSSNKKKR